jgi:hypothetical protein
MTHSEPTSVNLYLVPLAVISMGRLSLRIAGPHVTWA